LRKARKRKQMCSEGVGNDSGVVSMLFSGFAIEPWLANTAVVSVIMS
jgi:hypothetical protein